MSRELPTLAVFEDDIGVPRTLLETLSLLIALLALTAFTGLILCLALVAAIARHGWHLEGIGSPATRCAQVPQPTDLLDHPNRLQSIGDMSPAPRDAEGQ